MVVINSVKVVLQGRDILVTIEFQRNLQILMLRFIFIFVRTKVSNNATALGSY
jgi:hypothetical protein